MNENMRGPHTRFVFDKLLNFFSVMDAAIIENKNAAGTWVGIGEGNLNSRLDVKTQGMLNWLSTTSSRKKIDKFFGCHRTFNNIMCDDTVECNDREN